MPASQPTTLATSGGYRPGSRTRPEFNSLVHHAVELSGVTGRAPRVAGFTFSHLNLFPMPTIADPEAPLLEQDVVRVDGVGLVYHGTTLVEAVTEVRGKGAYRVTREAADHSCSEERLETRFLG